MCYFERSINYFKSLDFYFKTYSYYFRDLAKSILIDYLFSDCYLFLLDYLDFYNFLLIFLNDIDVDRTGLRGNNLIF
jgi:hypothetical protein